VDVCAVNAAGANNKYMVSTYSLPEQIASPQGDRAVYTCEGGKSGGAYAQCDGGLCFRSTEETTTRIGSPSLSTRAWILRPFTFLPAS
jgi:hypothetical protein